jgi:hypothetical protein
MALRRSGVRIPMAPRPKDVAFAEANVYPRFERSSFAAPEGQVYPSRRPSCNDREVPSPWLHVPRTWLSRKRTFIPDSNAVRLLRPKGKFTQAGGPPATTGRSHPHGSTSQGRGFRGSERSSPIRTQFVCSARRASLSKPEAIPQRPRGPIPMAPGPKDAAFAQANVYFRFECSSFALPGGPFIGWRQICNVGEVAYLPRAGYRKISAPWATPSNGSIDSWLMSPLLSSLIQGFADLQDHVYAIYILGLIRCDLILC